MRKAFYDIPVYRIGEEEYYLRRNKDISESIENCMLGLDPTQDMIKRNREAREQHFYDRYGPWRYNEIVGYIRLHFLGSQVRGEYVSAEKKRNGLSRTRVFTFRTLKLVAEANIWPKSSNADIFEKILEYLDRCQREVTKGRFIDRELFEDLGRHVDWRSFLGWPVINPNRGEPT